MGLVDSIDSFRMEQMQRVIDQSCSVRHKVLMERAVDTVFEIPSMSAERRAQRKGKLNSINELHSAAKVRDGVNTAIDTLIHCMKRLCLLLAPLYPQMKSGP